MPWLALVDRCAFALGEHAGRLGLLYVIEPLATELETIARVLPERTGVTRWCGAVGAGVCASAVELFDQPATAILTLDMPDSAFHVFATTGRCRVPAPPESRRITRISASSTATRATDGAEHFAEGARTGDLSGVLFGEDVAVVTDLTHGCTPLGTWHDITDAGGHVIAVLDGHPAVDVLRDEVGGDELARAQGDLHAALPIGGSDTSDYMVATINPARIRSC